MRSKLLLLILLSFVTTSCALWKGGTERYHFGRYSDAEQHFKKGEYEEAIENYQAYIDENPEGNLAIIAEYYIAKSHASLGHTDEAKARFEKIKQTYPDSTWAQFSENQLEEMAKAAPASAPAPPSQ
jgi:TolA-binding protein